MAWAASSTVDEDWGRLRVLIGPQGSAQTDVTFFRDVPAEVVSWSSSDPFGDETGVIRFPQITPFDLLGDSTLGWLVEWANVDIQLVHPDGSTLTTLWEGMVAAWDFDQDERQGSLTVTCIGSLHQLRLYKRSPKGSRAPSTLDDIFTHEFSTADNDRPAGRWGTPVVVGGPTGISFVNRPAWLDAASTLMEFLSRSSISNGTDQWTVQKVAPRVPTLIKRSAFGTTYTLTVGTPGLTVRLSQDFYMTRNVIYGEGVDTLGGGGKWRNFFLPEFFQPIGYDPAVHPFDEDGAGGLATDNARVDENHVRIEDFINFGEGYSLLEAKALADQYIDRDQDPGWVGTMTLRIDPEEGSRYQLKAGDRINLKEFAGSAAVGISFTIAHVDVNIPALSVTLAVDTKSRDYNVLQKILERNKEGTAPSRRLQLGRESGQIADSKFPWDDSNGAGWYPRERAFDGTSTVSLTANTWNVHEIVGAEGPDLIVKLQMYLSVSTQFALAVCDWQIDTSYLPSNPLTYDGDWPTLLDIPGVLYAAGSLGQRAGYWPGTESNGDSVTGVHVDEGTWPISHSRGTPDGAGDSENSGSPAKLWVAIFAASTCTAHGQLIHGVE